MTRFRWALAAILAIGLFVRLFGLNWDQGHFYHPDERRIAEAVMHISFKPLQLNPDFFAYGSLPFYATRAVTGVLAYYDASYRSYDKTIAVGRALSALYGTLTILVLALLGRRLYGDKAALLAATFYAIAVLPVQNSHFGTNDIPLTLLILLVLHAITAALSSPRALAWFALSGVWAGFAAATKFSALPILVTIAVAIIVDAWRQQSAQRLFLHASLSIITFVTAFLLGSPYALLEFQAFARSIGEQGHMVRNAGDIPYTNQYVGVPKYLYDIRELWLWGLGPLLGTVALAGTMWRWTADRARMIPAEFAIGIWVLIFFLITGSFDVKFPRYLLPLYPILLLWGARLLVIGSQRSPFARAFTVFVLLGSSIYLLAFLSIYTRPHSMITASQWFYRNVAPGSKVLTQDWDEGYPFQFPGYSPHDRTIVPFGYYEPDSPAKITKLSSELATSDYAIFQTRRLYGAITQASAKFPLTNNYFHSLFAGDLGFTLVHDVSSRPSFLGLSWPTELADESFSIYDHPRALIFKNTGHLAATEIEDRILRGLPSRTLTRNDMLRASAGVNRGTRSGDMAAGWNSSLGSSLLLLLWMQALGLAAYGILARTLGPRLGLYSLSKIAGLLLFIYPPWLASALGWLPFSPEVLQIWGGLLILTGLAIARTVRRPTVESREIILTESTFLAAFLFFCLLRSRQPEIFWGEKPMDFSFLNTLYRSSFLPPPEPWAAGTTLSYSYFGHFGIAALGKALWIRPGVMFNLGIAIAAALTATGFTAAGLIVGRRWTAGLLALFLGLGIGNASGVMELWHRKVVNFDYFWATARVIPDTINEYPLWTFSFADLHAHALVIPFSLAAIAMIFLFLQRERQPLPPTRIFAWLLAGGLLAGAIPVTNSWSMPTYASLFLFALVLVPNSPAFRKKPWWTALAGIIFPFIGTALVAAALFAPFWLHFTPPPRNIGWEHNQFAPPGRFFLIFGILLVITLPVSFATATQRLRKQYHLLTPGRGLAVVLIVITASLFNWSALLHGKFQMAASIRWWAGCLFLLLAGIASIRKHPDLQRPLLLTAFTLAVLTGCDVIFVWDRMNTVFKFYLDAWLLLAVAGGVFLARGWSGPLFHPVARIVWRSIVVIGLLLGAFTGISGIAGLLKEHKAPGPEWTLDGSAYLDAADPAEAAAIRWVNQNIQGIPVLAEAFGPAYGPYSRISMHTGLPMILGWEYHVSQRGRTSAEINQRKQDLEKIYTSQDPEEVLARLKRYHVALVYAGPLELKTYPAMDVARFKSWPTIFTPVYENESTVIFAVRDNFRGSVPVSVVEKVAAPVPESQDSNAPLGQLSQPRGITTDAKGNVYVCDFGHARMQKFDSALKPVKMWGRRGSGRSEFSDPCGIAAGPDGNIYVLDTWNHRVQVFDPSGKYLREWAGGMFSPRGIAIAPNGDVWISDSGNNRLLHFGPDGTLKHSVGAKGTGPGQFTEPIGLAIDKEGLIYVADTANGRLQILSANGSFRSQFQVPGWRSEIFSEPTVAVDPSGVIWVTSPVDHDLRAYSQNGTLLRNIHGEKSPTAPFERAMGITIPPKSRDILVTDLENRVIRLRREP